MRCHSNSNATHRLLFIHPPKTGGSTIGSMFQPRRRLYQVIVHPRLDHSTVDYCGGHKDTSQLEKRCDSAYACCLWMMSFREPIARLKSAFSTSQEDQQHFDCPRGTWTHKRLRKKDKPPLTLERFAALPAAERRKKLNALRLKWHPVEQHVEKAILLVAWRAHPSLSG